MRWLLLLFLYAPAAKAVPVIPNFQTGSLTSHTETTSLVTESIVSEDFATGYEYTVSGTNIQVNGNLNPIAETTVNGWTSLGQRPEWSVVNPGSAFSYAESYQGPGLSNRTTIQRTTEITSITDTVSTFSQ